ncbi:hypothetical protein K2Z84_18870 [Candidatus Binatia bacterium]|nr:hypothetical protein [Candidatus Binatia bacterium]
MAGRTATHERTTFDPGTPAPAAHVATAATTPAVATVVPLVAVACAAAWIVLFYPGFMSPDSAEQLSQARTGLLSDWHSPIMALLWMATEHLVAGSAGMLVLHVALFWAGLALLARRIDAPPWVQAAFLIVLACTPPLLSLAGAIWKDVLLASLATLAFGVAGRSALFWPVALLATMSRHNAIPAIAVAVLLHLAPHGPSLRALANALVASAVLLALSLALNASVVQTRTTPVQMIALADLNGIAARTGDMPAVDECHHMTSAEPPARAVATGDPKVAAALARNRLRFDFCFDATASQTLLGQWTTLVAAHPLAYADVRATMASRLLGFRETPGNFMMAQSNYDPTNLGIEPPVAASPLQMRFGEWLWRLQMQGVFRPWIYGVLVVAAAVVATRRRRWWPCAIALSGIAFELALFLVAPSPDYRYSYWMIVAAMISAAWLLAETIGGAARRAMRAHAGERRAA